MTSEDARMLLPGAGALQMFIKEETLATITLDEAEAVLERIVAFIADAEDEEDELWSGLDEDAEDEEDELWSGLDEDEEDEEEIEGLDERIAGEEIEGLD